MDIPESMTLKTLWLDRKPTQFLAQTGGQAFKIVQIGKGKRKLIVYCKNWQSLHTLLSLQSSLENDVFQWTCHTSPSHQAKTGSNTRMDWAARQESLLNRKNHNNSASKSMASSQKPKSTLKTHKEEKQTTNIKPVYDLVKGVVVVGVGN
jgi:hypothetical protein